MAAQPMFAKSKVLELFPTVIWMVDLAEDAARTLNRRIVAALESELGQLPELALGRPWQTRQDVHTWPGLEMLDRVIRAGAKGALEFLKIEHDGFDITGCWANIYPPGAINSAHNHPNNYLSGVYYVRTGRGADNILFSDPRIQASIVSPPVREETIYTGNQASLEAKEGRLLIFPAWLVHSVPPNRSNHERISVSFNIMFSHFDDTMTKPKWQPSVGGGDDRRDR